MEKFKDILLSEDTRKSVKEGVKIATGLIAQTLGARGKKIIIDKEYGKPEIIDDGAIGLKNIELEDPKKQLGVKLLQDVSGQTNDVAGDGTTTATILADALIGEIIPDKKDEEQYAITEQSVKKVNPLKIRKELKAGVEKVVAFINKHKIEITTDEQLFDIGRVSSNSDEVGKMLAEVYKKLGKDAAITVSDSQSINTEYEIVEGMKFDKGFLSNAFVNDGEKQRAVIEKANILVTDHAFKNPEDVDIIKRITMTWQGPDGIKHEAKNDLLIIADEVSGIPLEVLALARLRGGLRVVAVKAPGFGNAREYLQDIAALVGAKFISKETGLDIKEILPEWLGSADKVVSTQDTTTIFGGHGNKKEVDKRVKALRNLIKENPSGYEKEKLKERVAKLTGGVGIIKVGGATQLEVDEKKAKLDDAINAVRGAMEDGIVAGGGITLYRAALELFDDIPGEKILKRAIQKPFEYILKNADLDVDEIEDKVLKSKNINYGFDVENEKFGDMIEMGIVDPAKVTKTALQNAVSVALLVLDTGGSIVNIRKKGKDEERNDE